MPRGSQHRCQFNKTFTSVIGLLFSDSKTMAALVNYPCKSFVIMTSDLKATIRGKSLGTLLHLWGIFQFIHASPSCHPTNNVVLQVSNLHRMGGGKTAGKFQKVCNAFLGNQEITEGYEYCITVPRSFVPDCSC